MKGIPLFKKTRYAIDENNVIMQENIIGNRMVRAFNMQEAQMFRYKKGNESLKKKSISSDMIFVIINPIITLIMNASSILIFLFCGMYAKNAPADTLEQIKQTGQLVGVAQAFINYFLQMLVGLSKLINLDIYDYDIEKMIKYCEKKDVHEEWKKSYEKVSDLYFEIVLNQEEMDEYRRERRENRTRVEAMGFGLSGLATGMATAGAINLVTGLGHGAFNLIGKGLNAIGNKVALSSRFNNPETKQCLLNGVASLLVNVFSCYMYIVNEKKGNYYKYTTVTESNECEPIYINLSNNLIKDENKKIELICTIINKCPYTYKYYVIAFNLLGDKDGELQRLADFCNVGLKDYKINILNQEFNKIMESVKTEDEAKSIKERIIFRCNELHISSNNYVIDNIDDILAEFDLEQRTVEGIVFDTREMANDAKNELVEINNDYSDKIRNVYEDGNWKKLDCER